MCIPHCDSCLSEGTKCGTWGPNCCDGTRCCGYDVNGVPLRDVSFCSALNLGDRECMGK